MSDDGITAATEFTDESLGQAGRILQWQLSQQGLNNTHISETAVRQMYPVKFSQQSQVSPKASLLSPSANQQVSKQINPAVKLQALPSA